MIKIPELRSEPDLGGKDDLVTVAEECERLFKATVKKIEEIYVSRTDEWVEENDPELARELKGAEDELNAVWRANIVGNSSIIEFKLALKRYFEVNLKANERHKWYLLTAKV